MTTVALKNQNVVTQEKAESQWQSLYGVNKYIAASTIFIALFLAYLVVPHVGTIRSVFHLSVFYVIVCPIAAFIFAILGVHQIYKTGERGLLAAYITLAISTLYLVVGMAIPVVLVGFYILYAYVL
jgi:hypothetical protein